MGGKMDSLQNTHAHGYQDAEPLLFVQGASVDDPPRERGEEDVHCSGPSCDEWRQG